MRIEVFALIGLFAVSAASNSWSQDASRRNANSNPFGGGNAAAGAADPFGGGNDDPFGSSPNKRAAQKANAALLTKTPPRVTEKQRTTE